MVSYCSETFPDYRLVSFCPHKKASGSHTFTIISESRSNKFPDFYLMYNVHQILYGAIKLLLLKLLHIAFLKSLESKSII